MKFWPNKVGQKDLSNHPPYIAHFSLTGSFYSNAASSKTASGKSVPVTIRDLDERARSKASDLGGMVTVEGYIAGENRFDQPNQTVKYLLFSGITNKKGDFPAVMLFFKKEAWNVDVSFVCVCGCVCVCVRACVCVVCVCACACGQCLYL